MAAGALTPALLILPSLLTHRRATRVPESSHGIDPRGPSRSLSLSITARVVRIALGLMPPDALSYGRSRNLTRSNPETTIAVTEAIINACTSHRSPRSAKKQT